MKVIGLTGGIGSGKSTVSAYLEKKGYSVIDADKMSHEITKKGSPCLEKLTEVFGSGILFQDGRLDRRKLGRMVFSDPLKKSALEELTTKAVAEDIKTEIGRFRERGNYAVIFIDAPLLFETGLDALTDAVWLVTAGDEERIKRIEERDGLSEDEIRARMDSQMSVSEKSERSDEIIDNSGRKEELYLHIERLLNKYV